MRKRLQLEGMRFGRLYVIRFAGIDRHSRSTWRTRCQCGKIVNIVGRFLINGDTRSCGCLQDQIRKSVGIIHGMSRTPIYRVWQDMIQRCYNRTLKNYSNYGARGIRVCTKWKRRFQDFYDDMGPRPSPRHTIGRKDNDGNYSPENCRWETRKQQQRNTRRNIFITFNGKRKCLFDWSVETGISRYAIAYRIKRQWPVAIALTQPTKKRSASE